jgi:preprotein translocase subunit SecF
MTIIKFSKAFVPAAIFSVLLIIFGIVGYIVKGGFNLGVDFKAGQIQEVQFAPTAFSLSYSGKGNAVVSFSRNALDIVVSGPNVDDNDFNFPYADYPTLQAMSNALTESIEGLSAEVAASGTIQSQWILPSAQGNPRLGLVPFVVHYLQPNSEPIDLARVRDAITPLGNVSVQVLGEPSDRHFMIRMDEKEDAPIVPPETIVKTLEESFGAGEVVITRSDYVGSRFSKQLSDQAGLLMILTLFLILVYASIRFKPQFAIGAVLAIAHDALIMVGFIVWTRMEFNTTTIAAILTILGYSINDTIVIFDRIRETRHIYPDESFINVLDRALTETLGRTIITTVTTMIAVLSLFIFTTGSMKDFALALLVGMVSGVYSTIYIASGFANFWEDKIKPKLEKKHHAPAKNMAHQSA